MKWSWKIGRIAGIGLYVHATFFLLLAWVGYAFYSIQHSFGDVLNGLILIGALFFIVILHELGHALAARRFGIETSDITLLPIGGVARLERMPDKPLHELVVALAGPAVNVALALPLAAILYWSNALSQLTSPEFIGAPFVAILFWANVTMAVFNLAPAFPMDGGRILRALLALRLNYAKATKIAANIGKFLALCFGLFVLFTPHSNPILILIPIFIWFGATEESNMVQIKYALKDIPVSQIMLTRFEVLDPDETISNASEVVLSGFQQDFPVVSNGALVGLLTRNDMVKALARQDPATPVGIIMRRRVEAIVPEAGANEAYARLRGSDVHSLPVIANGQMVGMVTAEIITTHMAMHDASKS